MPVEDTRVPHVRTYESFQDITAAARRHPTHQRLGGAMGRVGQDSQNGCLRFVWKRVGADLDPVLALTFGTQQRLVGSGEQLGPGGTVP
jgi:hypothetical protein